MSLDEAQLRKLDELAPMINATISKFEDLDEDEDAQDPKAKESEASKIVNTLLYHGLARKQRLVPSAVRVHPENRFTVGVDTLDVHELLRDIVEVGWAWDETVGACAFSLKVGDAAAEQHAFQKKLYDESDGMLPLDSESTAVALSVTKSHTNMALRVISRPRSPNFKTLMGRSRQRRCST